LGHELGVPVHADRESSDAVKIAKAAVEESKRERERVVIVDTAGRLQIDDAMMDELARLKAALRPDEILLVADGMTGQEAVRIAEGFDQRLGLTGVILTKMDGDARGGAALSIYGVTKKPIKYVGVGEKADALDEFHPERMAGRILQMGDVVTLVEKAQQAFDADEARKLDRKVRKQGMDLDDFLAAMRQIEKLGPLEGMLKLLPGVNAKMLGQLRQNPDRMKHAEARVLSMTPEERKNPAIINGSRRARIARGSGRPVSDVNRLLDQFREMQKMMKKMAGGGGRMPAGMFGMR
jgi:signal recognition particle subunit SRP54